MPSPTLSAEEKLFCDRVSDAIYRANNKGICGFIGFLDERQQMLAVQVCREQAFDRYRFHGGYPDATRRLLGVFADHIDMGDSSATDALFAEEFCCVRLSHYRTERFTHRDVLGALIGLGLQRAAIGDILVQEQSTVLFVRSTVAQTVCDELVRVGKVPVQRSLEAPGAITFQQQFKDLRGTVASARADCVTAFVTGMSREKAAALICSGSVSLNCQQLQSLHTEIQAGDVLSVRGHGKFKVDDIGALTKKGRMAIGCKKYV